MDNSSCWFQGEAERSDSADRWSRMIDKSWSWWAGRWMGLANEWTRTYALTVIRSKSASNSLPNGSNYISTSCPPPPWLPPSSFNPTSVSANTSTTVSLLVGRRCLFSSLSSTHDSDSILFNFWRSFVSAAIASPIAKLVCLILYVLL